MQPLLSIIIPTKNRKPLLARTLDSIASQTYLDWEALVCDDGSTDGTQAFVQVLSRAEPRVRLIPGDPLRPGAASRRNDGIAAARGALVLFLDSDDLLAPECLARRVALMNRHPDLAFAVWATAIFRTVPGDTGVYWNCFDDRCDLDRFLAGDAPWSVTGPVWRKIALARIGGWDERQPSWQDWEFHIRALADDLPYAKVPEADNFYRRAGSQSDSISTLDASPERVLHRIRLFDDIHAYLNKRGKLTGRGYHNLRHLAMQQFWNCYPGAQDPATSRRLLTAFADSALCATYEPVWFRVLRAASGSRVRLLRWLAWGQIGALRARCTSYLGRNLRNEARYIQQARGVEVRC